MGEYILPVAGIRAEGTSDYYFPPEVPALSNFLVQKAISEVLENEQAEYHVGITYTTNMRFWEFKEEFVKKVIASRAQCVEMECATLFSSSYKNKFNLGALLLISDLPLESHGIKTKESSEQVYEQYTAEHVEMGVKSLQLASKMYAKKIKGAYSRERE